MPGGGEPGLQSQDVARLAEKLVCFLPERVQQPPVSLEESRAIMEAVKFSGTPALALSFEPDCDEYYDNCQPTADSILLRGPQEIHLATESDDGVVCSKFERWARAPPMKKSQQFVHLQQDATPMGIDTRTRPQKGETGPPKTWWKEMGDALRSMEVKGEKK